MTKSNSNQVFPKYQYIVFCIVLIFGETYLTYSGYYGFWLSLFYNMAGLFSGLFSFLWAWMTYGDSSFNIWGSMTSVGDGRVISHIEIATF